MSKLRWITAAVLAAVLGIVVAALFGEAAGGPTFRAADHADYQECMRSIPNEWAPGSLPRTGAEDACYYVHRRRPGGR